MSQILLFSAGLDSFPAWYRLGRPPAVCFDLRHRYAAQERAAVARLAKRCGIPVVVSTELDLAARELPDAIIPLRNAYLALLASERADTIWCVGVRGDNTLDKSPEAFTAISGLITRLRGKSVTVDSPFWDMTKTEIVGWYLAEGLPVENLLLTFSCGRLDGRDAHCGACPSCLRRWISLVNNGIEGPFDANPWEWDRVAEYYVPAMRTGHYPEHRATEFFAALDTVGGAPC